MSEKPPAENKEKKLLTKEIEIESGDIKLKGNIFYPTGNELKYPAILFIQGFGSSQNSELAKTFTGDGFVSLTVDLRGHGETPGDRNSFPRKDYLADAEAAYDFLVHDPKVDSNRITVFGTSFGAYLGTILSSERSISNLILRAPTNYPDNGFDEEPGLPTSDYSKALEWRKKSMDINGTLSLSSLHKFEGKVLIVEGLQDEKVPYQTVENYLNAVKNPDNVTHGVLLDASHSISKDEDVKEKFKFMTRNWLLKNAK